MPTPTKTAACLTTMCAVDLDVNWRNVDGKKVYCLHVVLLSVKRVWLHPLQHRLSHCILGSPDVHSHVTAKQSMSHRNAKCTYGKCNKVVPRRCLHWASVSGKAIHSGTEQLFWICLYHGLRGHIRNETVCHVQSLSDLSMQLAVC